MIQILLQFYVKYIIAIKTSNMHELNLMYVGCFFIIYSLIIMFNTYFKRY